MYSYFEHLIIVKCVNTIGFKITCGDLGELGGEGVFKYCLGQGKYSTVCGRMSLVVRTSWVE